MLPKNLVIVQVHMLTISYEEEDIEEIHDNIESLFNEEKDCCKVIFQDWNVVRESESFAMRRIFE